MSVISRAGFGTVLPPVVKREQGTGVGSSGKTAKGDFSKALEQALPGGTASTASTAEQASVDRELSFSRHASSRLKSRGIELSSQDVNDLADAVDRLQGKSARESLLLLGDNAFIVGVPKRTVITAMTRQEAVGSIFTNIDSTLVVR